MTTLRSIVQDAAAMGLDSQQIVNFLNRPIPEDSSHRALLSFIWSSNDHHLISIIARNLLKENTAEINKTKKLSLKETFRKHFGPINDENLREAASTNPSLVCQLIDEDVLSTQALAAAAEAIGYALNPELIDRLISLLSHPNAYVREGAVTALASYLYHGIEKQKIVKALQYDETSKAVKESIHEALELGD